MSPLIPLFIGLAETLLQEEPAIVAEVQAILAKPNPTPADWLALHQQVLAKTYADYVPASALPAATSGPAPAPAAPAAGLAAAETAALTTLTTESAPISQTSAEAPAEKPAAYLADGTKNPAFVE